MEAVCSKTRSSKHVPTLHFIKLCSQGFLPLHPVRIPSTYLLTHLPRKPDYYEFANSIYETTNNQYTTCEAP